MDDKKAKKLQDYLVSKDSFSLDPHFGTKFICETIGGSTEVVIHAYTSHHQELHLYVYDKNNQDREMLFTRFDVNYSRQVLQDITSSFAIDAEEVKIYADVSEYDLSIAFSSAFNLIIPKTKKVLDSKFDQFTPVNFYGSISPDHPIFDFSFNIPDDKYWDMRFGPDANPECKEMIAYFSELHISNLIKNFKFNYQNIDGAKRYIVDLIAGQIDVSPEVVEGSALGEFTSNFLKETLDRYIKPSVIAQNYIKP